MNKSKEYVENLIYDSNRNIKPPILNTDLYMTVSNLVYLYKENPEWDESFKDDIKTFVENCIDLMEKM